MDIKEKQIWEEQNKYRHPWELARLEIIKKQLNQITKNKDLSNINIIDIGCGDLFVLENINEHFNFKQLIGVDIAFDKNTLELKNKEYRNTKINIYNNLKNIELNDESVSIILLLDIVEHIDKDKDFITDLLKTRFVNNKSIFFITVPSFQSLFSQHDKFLNHFRRYNNSDMIDLLKTSGYKILKSGYFFILLLLPRIFTVIKERYFKKNNDIEINNTSLTTWKYGRFITLLVKNILLLDYYLLDLLLKLNIKLPGLSNYVICKKYVS